MKIIGLEEHFVLPEVLEVWKSAEAVSQGMPGASESDGPGPRLLDFGQKRLEAMDAAGVDVQVLSLTTPGTQSLDAGTAIDLARISNDRVAEVIRSNPDRFQGFAT